MSMSKYTADNITDEQIRELRDSILGLDRASKYVRELCDVATGRFAMSTAKAKRAARGDVAEILNARAAELKEVGVMP